MGLPDLPEQTEDDGKLCMDHDNIINVEVTSDESDNESMDENEYMGYQPLSIHDYNEETHNDSQNIEMEAEPSDRYVSNNLQRNNQEFLNLEVWNTPRPEVLNIELDHTKAAQIKNVMANFKLPVTSVPEWAVGVPEEKWKEDLLERIRQKQNEDLHKSPAD